MVLAISGLAIVAAGVTGVIGQVGQDRVGHFLGVANDADGDLFGQADAIGVDVDLNDLGVCWPVIDAVARQGRERVQTGAKGQNNIGLG